MESRQRFLSCVQWLSELPHDWMTSGPILRGWIRPSSREQVCSILGLRAKCSTNTSFNFVKHKIQKFYFVWEDSFSTNKKVAMMSDEVSTRLLFQSFRLRPEPLLETSPRAPATVPVLQSHPKLLRGTCDLPRWPTCDSPRFALLAALTSGRLITSIPAIHNARNVPYFQGQNET